MAPTLRAALLEFDPRLNRLSKAKTLQDGLSAAVRIGETLWVANDETVSLERLSRLRRRGGDPVYGDHEQFPLAGYLRLPAPGRAGSGKIGEVDIEGLDFRGGYLWLTGSHSLQRKQPREGEPPRKNRERLADVSADGNRFLVARIPVVEAGGVFTLEKEAEGGGARRVAAQLRGDAAGNELTRALAEDEHLAPFFTTGIPGKDNGFDIEGLAAAPDRLFLGLRGPVLRGWAIVLELAPEEDGEDRSTLKLQKIGPGGRRYRKHFLDLRGLGIRDLAVHGSDLLILAGPSMDLDGPVAVYRWPGGAEPDAESLVFAADLPKLMDIPYGRGDDHPEGMALCSPDGGAPGALLIVYDAASEARKAGAGVKAGIFPLP